MLSNLRLRSNNDRKPIGNEKHMFKFNVHLKHSFSSPLIYSDIADFTFVGDILASSLRVVPFNPVTESVHSIKNLKHCIMFQYLNLP